MNCFDLISNLCPNCGHELYERDEFNIISCPHCQIEYRAKKYCEQCPFTYQCAIHDEYGHFDKPISLSFNPIDIDEFLTFIDMVFHKNVDVIDDNSVSITLAPMDNRVSIIRQLRGI